MQGVQPGVRTARSAVAILGILLVLFPLAIVAGYVLPSPVALVAPGSLEPVEGLIRVEGTSYEPQGHLYLATVHLAFEPRLGHYLLAKLQPDVEEVPKSEVIPPFLSREEFQKLSQRLLAESQSIAQVVALRQAGYDVKVGDPDVEVVATVPGSPASEELQAGDVIRAANGERVVTTAELVSIVHGCVSGEPVFLNIRRDGREVIVRIPTMRGPLDTEGPVLGIVAVTRGFDYRAPVSIQIDSGQVAGGASAGLMYALGVYNALATEDITRGRRIAGTGSIRLNGTVGPVGAIRLKVRAAEEAGAEYFLAPLDDAPAARAAARDMKVIPVGSFQEALAALQQLDVEPGRSPHVVPASGDTTLAHLPLRSPQPAHP